MRIVQFLQPDDCPGRVSFATDISCRIDEDNDYLSVFALRMRQTFTPRE